MTAVACLTPDPKGLGRTTDFKARGGYHLVDRRRGSVVLGGNAEELALANDGEGVYLPVEVNTNDADASEDPAQRALRSFFVGDERPTAQGGTA